MGVKIPFKDSTIHIKYPSSKIPIHIPGHGLKIPTIQKPIHIPPGVIKPGWAPKCPQPSVPTLIPANTIPAVTPLFPVKPIVPLPNPVVPVLPKPLLPLPSPTVPQFTVHRPVLPLPRPFIPVHPAPVLPVAAPAAPVAPLVPSVLRPGNSVHTSYFATFPKYPIGYKPLQLIPQHIPAAPLPLAPLPVARPTVQFPIQYPLRPAQIPVNIGHPTVHIPQKQFIPTSAGTNIHVTGVDNNVWTPMISPNGDSGLPFPHQPQFIPQEPDNTAFENEQHEHHEHHQGYHYPQPQNNQPLLEDLHSHFREQLRKQQEQRHFDEEQQYLSANQQASADPQHEPQFPQAFPAHHLSGKPIIEAFGNIFQQRLRPQH